jgi:hypothetical protein
MVASNPPFIYGRRFSTVFLPLFLPLVYLSSTSHLPCLPPRVDDGCQDVYLSTSRLPLVYLSTSSLPLYLRSTSALLSTVLALYLPVYPTSPSFRLPHIVPLTPHRTQSRSLLRYDNYHRMNYVYQLITRLAINNLSTFYLINPAPYDTLGVWSSLQSPDVVEFEVEAAF